MKSRLLILGIALVGCGKGTEWTSKPLKPQVATLDDPKVKIELDLPEGVVRAGAEAGNTGGNVEQSRFRFDNHHGDKTDLTLMVDIHRFLSDDEAKWKGEAGRATLEEFLATYGNRGTVLRKDKLADGYIVTQHDPNNSFATHKVTVVRDIGGRKIHCEAEGNSPTFADSTAALEAVCLSMRTPKG